MPFAVSGRLRSAGRFRHPADRRARLVRPTAAGHTVLARAGARLRVLHDRWAQELEGVSVAQVVQALGILIRICEEPRT